MAGSAWDQYVKALLAAFVGALALMAAFVALMNPYGNLPPVLFKQHVIMDQTQRFQYPSIARSAAFDSIVIGTSSSRLLEPARLDATFGGAFANLAMNDARAWEEYQLALLFLRHTPAPRRLIFGLDWVWCTEAAATDRTRRDEFPLWLYDEDPLNDWFYLLNTRAIEISFRRLGFALGFGTPALPPDGYKVFVSPDASYDAAKARQKIHGSQPVATLRPTDSVDPATWQFPALAWLADVAGRLPPQARIAYVFMPAHTAILPPDDSVEGMRLDACKRRVVALAERTGGAVVDLRFRSPLTVRDENFWDPLHYRVGIADRIVDHLRAAVPEWGDGTAAPSQDPASEWRRLDRRRNVQ